MTKKNLIKKSDNEIGKNSYYDMECPRWTGPRTGSSVGQWQQHVKGKTVVAAAAAKVRHVSDLGSDCTIRLGFACLPVRRQRDQVQSKEMAYQFMTCITKLDDFFPLFIYMDQ